MQQVKDRAVNIDTWAESAFGEDLVFILKDGQQLSLLQIFLCIPIYGRSQSLLMA